MLASANPGTHLVDLLPSLDRLPDILAPWRAAALDQHALNHRVFLGLLRSVWEKVARGELAADNAFVTRLWEGQEQFVMDELVVSGFTHFLPQVSISFHEFPLPSVSFHNLP
ncbi:hypothetical protein JB92DRAFT_3138446 [Gautieria morchelliformis]|nr:hypothetical protein JB92DRAFT_3138446 [Gautieria morchelliformis]